MGIIEMDIFRLKLSVLAAFALCAASAFAEKYETSAEKRVFDIDPSQWRAVDVRLVENGTVLDLSPWFPHEVAGSRGRLVVSKDAGFAFESAPDKSVKFKGTNWRPANFFGSRIKTHEDIDKIARSIRVQGYNLLRWRISMKQSREFDAPYRMKPEVRDLYDYFIYALAQNGVYSHFHLASHDLGDPSFKWKDRGDVKLRMILGDQKTWEDWRSLVKMQLEHVNPYTGRAWKDDPSIITTEYFNELELGIILSRDLSPKAKAYADAEFANWLAKNGAEIGELNALWGTSFKSVGEVRVFGSGGNVVHSVQFSKFFEEKSLAMMEFCRKVVRDEVQCKTLLHQFNCGIRPDIWQLGAEGGNYMALNVYSRNEGGTIGEFCRYWRSAAAKRAPDMPMFITEFQHLPATDFVNETGVIFPAYSALQGFSVLCVHDSGAFQIAADQCCVASNPIMRANEFLSAAMFYRGDVAKSAHRVDFVYSAEFLKDFKGMGVTPYLQQQKVGFLTGIASAWPTVKKRGSPADLTVAPASFSLEPEGGNTTGKDHKSPFDLSGFVEKMRAAGILKKDNITDIDKGIFQSDTGEIVMRQKEGLAKVCTPLTEAVTLKPSAKAEKVGVLSVNSTTAAATVAAISMDALPLAESGKIVFVYATSALVNARRAGSQDEPIAAMVRTGKLSASLRLGGAKEYKIYALALDGTRAQRVPATFEGGELRIEIDTAKLSKEPAVFYEITAE